jgi:hypothetical protein
MGTFGAQLWKYSQLVVSPQNLFAFDGGLLRENARGAMVSATRTALSRSFTAVVPGPSMLKKPQNMICTLPCTLVFVFSCGAMFVFDIQFQDTDLLCR